MLEYLIFKYRNENIDAVLPVGLQFQIERPSLLNSKPKWLSEKYRIYYLFYLLGIFKNKHYYYVSGWVKGELSCFLIVVPKYYRWPFMGDSDVQLMYVVTKDRFKGKGFGTALLQFTINFLKSKNINSIWYVTDTDNIASQKLAAKVGFTLFSKAKRSYLFNIKFLKTLVIKK